MFAAGDTCSLAHRKRRSWAGYGSLEKTRKKHGHPDRRPDRSRGTLAPGGGPPRHARTPARWPEGPSREERSVGAPAQNLIREQLPSSRWGRPRSTARHKELLAETMQTVLELDKPDKSESG